MEQMDKDVINALPQARWHGPVAVVRTADAAQAAVRQLTGGQVLGFDTETRPAFRKGERYLPSLVQLALENEVYIFQIHQHGVLTALLPVLEDPTIVKAGVAPLADCKGLQEHTPFLPAGFVDLARMARQRGLRSQGLRSLAAATCEVRIAKSAQTSNWAKAELTAQQIQYAATDAWIGREIYQRLLALPAVTGQR